MTTAAEPASPSPAASSVHEAEEAMKFFTRELYERCQSDDDAVLDAAEEEWESALEHCEQHLQAIGAQLPAHLRQFQELLLHDAVVQSIAREGDRLFLILRTDIPPHDLVILCYDLEREPVLEPFARCPRDWGPSTDFNCDEFDVIHEEGRALYTQDIVFGNGWLLRLCFRDVRVTRAASLFPVEAGAAIPNLCPPIAQSA
jgi:hypothetical protein